MAFTSGTTGTPKAALHTPPRPAGCLRGLAAARAPRDAGRHRCRLAAAGVHLRPGGLLVFPMWAGASVFSPTVPTRRNHGPRPSAGGPPSTRRPRSTGALAAFADRPNCRNCASASAPARRCPTPHGSCGSRRADRDAGRHRCHRDVPHLHSSQPEDVSSRCHWHGGAGYRAQVVDGGQALPRGTVGKLAVIGRPVANTSTSPASEEIRRQRLELPGDSFSHGCRWLLLLSGPRRRHDHYRGLQRGWPRGETACAAPGGG